MRFLFILMLVLSIHFGYQTYLSYGARYCLDEKITSGFTFPMLGFTIGCNLTKWRLNEKN